MDLTGFREERILAIDFGIKRVGLALSDPLKIFAYPFKTIPNDNKLLESLGQIIKESYVVKIVLGYPLKENGQKSETTLLVEKFKEEFESRINVPIILRDERYSSQLAKENIISSVTSKKKRRDKGLIDRNAASIILQEYLDEKH
ncbi:MAG: Holliday junction resolvase RuvX [Bacillota bacterium]